MKLHLYNKDGEYKAFNEEDIDAALKTGVWFKTKALAKETPVKEDKLSLADFSDKEILDEATKRGLIEEENPFLGMSFVEIKEKYTIPELKKIGKGLNMRFKPHEKEDEIINRIIKKLKG